MMMAYQRHDISQLGDGTSELRTLDRMRAHDHLLFRSQSSWLAKNRSKHLVNLPYVMQESRGHDSLDFLFSKTNRPCDNSCFFGDSP